MRNSKFAGWVLVTLLAVAASAVAQDGLYKSKDSSTYNHGEIGVFANYTRLHNAGDTNFWGAGGRLGFNVHRNVQLEAEGAYDFERNTTASINNGGGSFTTQASALRMTHFLFGPKLQLGTSGPVRLFGTVKGGLVNFSTDAKFSGQVSNIPYGDTNGVFYPGGGLEFYAGWLGMRFEAGDEMYIDHGVNHNLRVTVGPTLRF